LAIPADIERDLKRVKRNFILIVFPWRLSLQIISLIIYLQQQFVVEDFEKGVLLQTRGRQNVCREEALETIILGSKSDGTSEGLIDDLVVTGTIA
jgi:hypothetical protein